MRHCKLEPCESPDRTSVVPFSRGAQQEGTGNQEIGLPQHQICWRLLLGLLSYHSFLRKRPVLEFIPLSSGLLEHGARMESCEGILSAVRNLPENKSRVWPPQFFRNSELCLECVVSAVADRSECSSACPCRSQVLYKSSLSRQDHTGVHMAAQMMGSPLRFVISY